MAARKTSQPRGAGGKFKAADLSFTVVADAENAIQTFEDVRGSVGEVEIAMDNLGSELGEVSGGFDRASNSTKGFDDGINTTMINLTMGVSALNQMTGALYKTIGGLEAAGLINQETAQDWQKNARIIELFTGPLEFVISLMIAYELAILAGIIKVGAFSSAIAYLTGGAGLGGLMTTLGTVLGGLASFVSGVLVVVAVVLTIAAAISLWNDRAQVMASWGDIVADRLDRIAAAGERAKEVVTDMVETWDNLGLPRLTGDGWAGDENQGAA